MNHTPDSVPILHAPGYFPSLGTEPYNQGCFRILLSTTVDPPVPFIAGASSLQIPQGLERQQRWATAAQRSVDPGIPIASHRTRHLSNSHLKRRGEKSCTGCNVCGHDECTSEDVVLVFIIILAPDWPDRHQVVSRWRTLSSRFEALLSHGLLPFYECEPERFGD